MKLHLLLTVAALSIFTAGALALPPVEPSPSKYLTGSVCRDVNDAIGKGASQHKPVWIVAWDEAFFRSAEGRNLNTADYAFRYFYQNPETKKLVASNFVQAWTTMKNPAIQQYLDPSDLTHQPVFIVIGADGKLVERKAHYPNPQEGLKMVQQAIADLNKPAQ